MRAAVACLESKLAASSQERYELLRKKIMSMYELVNLLKYEEEHYARIFCCDKWQQSAVYKAVKKSH